MNQSPILKTAAMNVASDKLGHQRGPRGRRASTDHALMPARPSLPLLRDTAAIVFLAVAGQDKVAVAVLRPMCRRPLRVFAITAKPKL